MLGLTSVVSGARRRAGDDRLGRRRGRRRDDGADQAHRRGGLVEFVAWFVGDADPADLADLAVLDEREVDRGVGCRRQRHRDLEGAFRVGIERAAGERDDDTAVVDLRVDRLVPAVERLGAWRR